MSLEFAQHEAAEIGNALLHNKLVVDAAILGIGAIVVYGLGKLFYNKVIAN